MLQSLFLCHWCRKRRIIYYSEFVFELFGHSQVEGQLSELYENVGSDTERYWKQSRYLDADYVTGFLVACTSSNIEVKNQLVIL